MPINKNYFSISPSNDQPINSTGANLVTNGFSHRQGNPTIRISIPSVEKLLEVKTLRLKLLMIMLCLIVSQQILMMVMVLI